MEAAGQNSQAAVPVPPWRWYLAAVRAVAYENLRHLVGSRGNIVDIQHTLFQFGCPRFACAGRAAKTFMIFKHPARVQFHSGTSELSRMYLVTWDLYTNHATFCEIGLLQPRNWHPAGYPSSIPTTFPANSSRHFKLMAHLYDMSARRPAILSFPTDKLRDFWWWHF